MNSVGVRGDVAGTALGSSVAGNSLRTSTGFEA
jgi:hypothetical protein